MSSRRSPSIAAVCAGAFLGAIDVHLVNVAFPQMLRDFPGTDLAGLSWVFTGYTIAFTAALLPAGGLADRFGRRRVYLAGLTVFVAASVGCAIAPSPGVLIAARLVQGAGGGVITPLALALILPWFTEERRGTGIGLWSATQSVAIAAGPTLSGILVTTWDWRTIFWLHLPVGAAAIALSLATLPPDPQNNDPTLPDLPGLGLLAAAIGLPSLAIAQGQAWGLTDIRTALAMAAGLAAGHLFFRRSTRHPAPLVDLDVLRVTRRPNAAMFVLGLVIFAFPLAAVLFLTGVWGYSEARAGLAITPAPAVQVLVAPLAGRLMHRVGYRAMALGGAALLGASVILPALTADQAPAYPQVLLPALLVAGAGIAVLTTALSGAALADVPPSRLATGTALSVTSRACGAVLGLSALAAFLAGAPRDSLNAYQTVWWAMAVLCLTLLTSSLRLPFRASTGA
ncbi:MFS transporter [Actinomadura sp. 6N118]|uniref:MFS transporter n=1 Tax=Actinomadura sp. 6N118 TaxID=3375151 RepID=UPI0037AB0912